MRRWIAVLWHASFLVLAGVLYFFFVLPRWNELTGAWSETLGTAMRIVCGVLIGLSALPVVFTWLRTRKPEYGTPTLALTLRVCSIALQVLAGVLIVGAAISEIWLSLDTAGAWLFGIYGAAAALALLGAFAFHLAYVAELPPPPPKPLKPKSANQRRGRGKAAESEAEADELDEPETTEASEATEDDASVEVEEADETVVADEATDVADGNDNEKNAEKDSEESDAKLRNRRPAGKSSSRLFRRSRGGVALDD
ncbi:hypothetical protein [Mycolicibacterium sp. YH-1]|uniref:hypothetical protein n=1 Tax=Mycolicibacterium sp. YH-1 TaxID=2908837 RepID=UPI001F4C01C1|nr:hypothetical protein [Mycolicibacterium sp. YH-1]UNB53218.1 hypothetical protein L0M16_02250 [Mycolicibacterium sp. YH-1]